MRVWDVDPAYLNRQSLLGEHREIHAIVSIVLNKKRGYARHPETLRWADRLGALAVRHERVVSEMLLRGYRHQSPVPVQEATAWPDTFVDLPGKQFEILRAKYVGRESGRIPLPRTAQVLWQHHRFSVLARDPAYWEQMERELERSVRALSLEQLALDLVALMRRRPSEERLHDVLELVWEQVARWTDSRQDGRLGVDARIMAAWHLAVEHQVLSLIESTVWGDMAREMSVATDSSLTATR